MMIITAQTLATAHVGVWSSFLVVALLSVAALTTTPPKTPVKDRPNSTFILLKQTQRKQSRDEWVIKMKGLFGLKWKKMEVYVKREREREKGRMKRRAERVNAGKRVKRNKVLFTFGDQRKLINKRRTGNRESVLFCIPSATLHLEFFIYLFIWLLKTPPSSCQF